VLINCKLNYIHSSIAKKGLNPILTVHETYFQYLKSGIGQDYFSSPTTFIDYQARLLATAKLYYSQGFPSVIPLINRVPPEGFKKEKFKGWYIPFNTLLDQFIKNPGINGIGLMGGFNPIEGKYLSFLDIDHPQALEIIKGSKYAYITDTVTVFTPGDGIHLYLFTEREIKGVTNFGCLDPAIGEIVHGGEFRGSGSYTVCPPTKGYRFYEKNKRIRTLTPEEVEGLASLFGVEVEKGTTKTRERKKIESKRKEAEGKKYIRVRFSKECSDYIKALDQLIDLSMIDNFFSFHFNYWPGHCPFHPPDKRKSFGFFKGRENELWRCKCHHDDKKDHYNNIGLSLGEFLWWNLKAKESNTRARHIIGNLNPRFFKMINITARGLILNNGELINFLESSEVQEVIKARRRANRKGYEKAFILLFGLSIQDTFELPVDLLSEVIGNTGFQRCNTFLKQLEKRGFIKRVGKRLRSIRYEKGRVLNTYHKGIF